jgi:hypothetical protein
MAAPLKPQSSLMFMSRNSSIRLSKPNKFGFRYDIDIEAEE